MLTEKENLFGFSVVHIKTTIPLFFGEYLLNIRWGYMTTQGSSQNLAIIETRCQQPED